MLGLTHRDVGKLVECIMMRDIGTGRRGDVVMFTESSRDEEP